jgi:hypothetical protein
LEKAEDLLLKCERLESIAAVAISTGAPDADVTALAAGEASSAALLALGNSLKAISKKEKADREWGERA